MVNPGHRAFYQVKDPSKYTAMKYFFFPAEAGYPPAGIHIPFSQPAPVEYGPGKERLLHQPGPAAFEKGIHRASNSAGEIYFTTSTTGKGSSLKPCSGQESAFNNLRLPGRVHLGSSPEIHHYQKNIPFTTSPKGRSTDTPTLLPTHKIKVS